MEESTQRKRKVHSFIALDLIRGLAAFEVFLFHVRGATFLPFSSLDQQSQTSVVAVFFTATRFGREAVLIFFVLSGFLVGGSVLNQLRERRFDLQRYALDRATRVFLPLVPAVVIAFIVSGCFLHQSIPLAVWLAHLVALNGIVVPTIDVINPLWSLTYEIWFYVLAGGLACFLSKRSSGGLLVVLIASAALSVLQTRYVFFWCLGAAMVRTPRCRGPWAVAAGLLTATIGTGILEFSLAGGAVRFHWGNAVILSEGVGEALTCIGFCLLLPSLCSYAANRAIGPLAGIASTISRISYSLYLFHYPLLSLLGPFFPHSSRVEVSSLLRYVLDGSLCLAGVIAFYFALERNTSKLRRFLTLQVSPG